MSTQTPTQITPAAKTRLRISLVLNLVIVAMEIIGACMSFASHGFTMVQFYTEDSNLLSLAACGVTAYFTARALRGGANVPLWVRRFKYVSACCLALTFLVVIFVLAPTMGGGGLNGYYNMLLRNQMLFHHFLCPVLSVVSFVFFESDPLPSLREAWLPLIPTVCYAAVALVLNLLRVLDGPYPFLKVYNQPVFMSVVWCILIIGGDYGIACLVRFAAKKSAKKAAG